MINKKIASEIAVGIILLIAIVVGGIFWMQNGKVEVPVQEVVVPVVKTQPVTSKESLSWLDFSVDNSACVTKDGNLVDENGMSKIGLLLNGKNVAEIVSNELCPAGEGKVLKKYISKYYFSIMPEGIGGYILFSGIHNLYKFDSSSLEVRRILSGIDLSGSDIGFSNEEKFVFYEERYGFEKSMKNDNRDFILKNVDTGDIKKYIFPVEIATDVQVGDFIFAPNDKKIAFAFASNNPEKEYGGVYILNLEDGKYEIVTKQNYLVRVDGWEWGEKVMWSKMQ